MWSDDLLLAVVRYSPLVFIIGGLLVVAWLARQRSSHELQPDVLAALSETEALPAATIRLRPPLDSHDLDVTSLVRILDELCGAGLVVRWYEAVDATEVGQSDRRFVYRRISSVTGMAR
jgi:hypothetical protein